MGTDLKQKLKCMKPEWDVIKEEYQATRGKFLEVTDYPERLANKEPVPKKDGN